MGNYYVAFSNKKNIERKRPTKLVAFILKSDFIYVHWNVSVKVFYCELIHVWQGSWIWSLKHLELREKSYFFNAIGFQGSKFRLQLGMAQFKHFPNYIMLPTHNFGDHSLQGIEQFPRFVDPSIEEETLFLLGLCKRKLPTIPMNILHFMSMTTLLSTCHKQQNLFGKICILSKDETEIWMDFCVHLVCYNCTLHHLQ